jgi:hypothetical protein
MPLGWAGPETIVGGGGGFVSIAHVYELTVLSFPAASTARAFST